MLADALDATEDGRGNVVLLEAPAGLGKTSLLRAAAEAASGRGFRCLRARAGELEHLVEWTRGNHVRTVAGLASCALFAVALQAD